MSRRLSGLRLLSLLLMFGAVLGWPAPAWADTSYVVQPGDTLTRIAARFNTTVAALQQANHLQNADVLQVGQALTIPDGQPAPAPAAGTTTYVVQPGDSLARVAARFQVTVDALIRANGLASTTLQPGQTLIIPAAGGPPPLSQRLSGDAAFVRRVRAALEWLAANDPSAYARVDQYVTVISPSPYRDRALARPVAAGCLVRALARPEISTPMIAAILVHESVHCEQFTTAPGLTVKAAEVQAYTEQLAFMRRLDFPAEAIAYYERVLAYYQSQSDDGRPVPPPDF